MWVWWYMSEETGEKNSARERFHNDVMAKYQKAKKKKTAFILCATFLLSTSL